MKTLAMLFAFVLTFVAPVPAQTANAQLFPAHPGATWQPSRMYCWMVASERPPYSNELRGTALTRASAFQIQFLTLPDDTELEVVPGIGIVSYEYRRHGSVADTSFTPVEFHRAKRQEPGKDLQ
jgi:hypothetical protein